MQTTLPAVVSAAVVCVAWATSSMAAVHDRNSQIHPPPHPRIQLSPPSESLQDQPQPLHGQGLRSHSPVQGQGGATNGSVFNVRDFGAVGDGVTDDSAAVQSAIAAAGLAGRRYSSVGWDSVASRGTVLFPTGEYLLSATLFLPVDPSFTPPDLVGQGSAMLRQVNASADIVFGSNVVVWRASGLQFLGGRNQLHIGNNNTDKGGIVVTDCGFFHAGSAGVRLLEPSRSLQPDTVGKASHLRGPPHHTLESFHGSFSTQMTVRECRFVECAQAVVNWADWTLVESVWVTTSPSMPNDTAVFENHDRMVLSHIVGVPREVLGPTTRQRWVDNYAFRLSGNGVALRDFRMGGEGNGLGGIYNFAPFTCILIQSPYSKLDLCGRIPLNASSLPNGTDTEPAGFVQVTGSVLDTHQPMVVLEEVPSKVSITESLIWDGGNFPVLGLGDGVNLSSPLFVAAFTAAVARQNAMLTYTVDGTNWNGPATSVQTLPPELLPFVPGRVEASTAPQVGVWTAGQVVWAKRPTLGLAGWLCNASGVPGQWLPFGLGAVGGL